MTTGERLREEVMGVLGLTELHAVGRIADCHLRAKTARARERLAALMDSFLETVIRRPS